MNKTKTIVIPEAEAEMMQAFLDGQGHGSLDAVKTYTADFGKGIEVDIKVCDAERDSTPFVDPVIFDDGSEIYALEVTDTLLGEYIFEVDNDTYTVNVITEKKARKERKWHLLLIYFIVIGFLAFFIIFCKAVYGRKIIAATISGFAIAVCITSYFVALLELLKLNSQIPRKTKNKS